MPWATDMYRARSCEDPGCTQIRDFGSHAERQTTGIQLTDKELANGNYSSIAIWYACTTAKLATVNVNHVL